MLKKKKRRKAEERAAWKKLSKIDKFNDFKKLPKKI